MGKNVPVRRHGTEVYQQWKASVQLVYKRGDMFGVPAGLVKPRLPYDIGEFLAREERHCAKPCSINYFIARHQKHHNLRVLSPCVIEALFLLNLYFTSYFYHDAPSSRLPRAAHPARTGSSAHHTHSFYLAMDAQIRQGRQAKRQHMETFRSHQV